MNKTNLTEDQLRKQISAHSYEELMRINRFATAHHPYLRYAEGAYFRLILQQKKSKLTQAEIVATSKRIGWNPDTFNQTSK